MGRFAVYPGTSRGYIVVDTRAHRIIALYPKRRTAERVAQRLNGWLVTAPQRLVAFSVGV